MDRLRKAWIKLAQSVDVGGQEQGGVMLRQTKGAVYV